MRQYMESSETEALEGKLSQAQSTWFRCAAMADLFPICGLDRVIVGRIHRCNPRPSPNKPA
jgi:hypothetical protein